MNREIPVIFYLNEAEGTNGEAQKRRGDEEGSEMRVWKGKLAINKRLQTKLADEKKMEHKGKSGVQERWLLLSK